MTKNSLEKRNFNRYKNYINAVFNKINN